MRSFHVVRLLALLLVAVPAAIESPARAQTPAAAPVEPAQKTFAYEVVSITPRKSGDESRSWRTATDRIVMTNVPLISLVYSAYHIIIDDQISGLPGWARTDRYDIQAKMDEQATADWKNLTRQEQGQQQQLMIQALLADRCQLKVHRETKQLTIYDLVIAKGGLKMKEAKAATDSRYMFGPGHFNAQSVAIESLVFSLSGQVGRVIVDKTGLGDKKFEFDLKWTPGEQQGTADAGPSIFAALEEQLGLKLVTSHGPVETVVVDRMEKPSPN